MSKKHVYKHLKGINFCSAFTTKKNIIFGLSLIALSGNLSGDGFPVPSFFFDLHI